MKNVHLINTNATHKNVCGFYNKFYKMRISQNNVIIQNGLIGHEEAGRIVIKPFANEQLAASFIRTQMNKKLEGGYRKLRAA